MSAGQKEKPTQTLFCTHQPAFKAGMGVENVCYAMHTLGHVAFFNLAFTTYPALRILQGMLSELTEGEGFVEPEQVTGLVAGSPTVHAFWMVRRRQSTHQALGEHANTAKPTPGQNGTYDLLAVRRQR